MFSFLVISFFSSSVSSASNFVEFVVNDSRVLAAFPCFFFELFYFSLVILGFIQNLKVAVICGASDATCS